MCTRDRDWMFTVPPRPGEGPEQQRETERLTQLERALRVWSTDIVSICPDPDGYRCRDAVAVGGDVREGRKRVAGLPALRYQPTNAAEVGSALPRTRDGWFGRDKQEATRLTGDQDVPAGSRVDQ